jgi:hypothetical protein
LYRSDHDILVVDIVDLEGISTPSGGLSGGSVIFKRIVEDVYGVVIVRAALYIFAYGVAARDFTVPTIEARRRRANMVK